MTQISMGHAYACTARCSPKHQHSDAKVSRRDDHTRRGKQQWRISGYKYCALNLSNGKDLAVRTEWARTDGTCSVSTPRGVAHTSQVTNSVRWLRAKAQVRHGELLLATPHATAECLSLRGRAEPRSGRLASPIAGLYAFCLHFQRLDLCIQNRSASLSVAS